MAIQRDDIEERQARLDLMIEQLREAERAAVLKRGIALWRHTERQFDYRPHGATLPPEKMN